jgi:hypothetical protein
MPREGAEPFSFEKATKWRKRLLRGRSNDPSLPFTAEALQRNLLSKHTNTGVALLPHPAYIRTVNSKFAFTKDDILALLARLWMPPAARLFQPTAVFPERGSALGPSKSGERRA